MKREGGELRYQGDGVLEGARVGVPAKGGTDMGVKVGVMVGVGVALKGIQPL